MHNAMISCLSHGDECSQAPLDINIEAPDPSQMSDRVKLKAQQLRFAFTPISSSLLTPS